MSSKKTLIVGASQNPERFSYKAAYRLSEKKHPIILLGAQDGIVAGESILTEIPEKIEDLHTVSMYLSPEKQGPLEESILRLNPQRIIFNPGSENPSLMKKAQEKHIQIVANCTLVMLGAGTY